MEPTRSHNDTAETATPSALPNTPLQDVTPSPTPARHPLWRRILVRTLQVIFLAFIALVLFRIPHVIEKEKTDAVVAQIHATKLTMDDVMGTNLPPDPGVLADATIAGVDANTNGIRDDVELAIFRDYATSSQKRSAFLQYALAQQTMMTLSRVSPETVTAVIEDIDGRANICLWSLHKELRAPYDAHFNDPNMGELGKNEWEMWNQYVQLTEADEKYIKDLQFNSTSRTAAYKDILRGNLRSYTAAREGCDIDPSTLPD